MNKGKSPDEKFLEAQIALLMDASPQELNEYLEAGGMDPQDLENQGMNAVKGTLTTLQVTKQAAALSEFSAARQREIAGHLGIKRSVFTALAEHRAIVSSIPKQFLQRLASEMGTTVQALRLGLSAPVMPARAAQYKSDVAPKVSVQVPFEQLLREAGMGEEEIAVLMRDDS